VPRVSPIVCDFDFRPQPRRGASGGPHNAIAPAISFSQSSALFAPRITQSSSATTSLRSDDRVADRASHRVANRTVPESRSPYSSSTRGNGSVAELNEHVANANSAANSDQPTLGRPNPTTGEQQPHLPPHSKDPPASEKSLAASAPGVTMIQSSRRAQDNTTPGEIQAHRVETPPEVPVNPDESRVSTPTDKKGGHDSLNRQGTPSVVSSHVSHPPATEPLSLCLPPPQPPPKSDLLTIYPTGRRSPYDT
jgi:hypothetical protein